MLHIHGKFVGAPNHAKADVVPEERAQLEAKIALEQRHQRVDFGARSLPVLDRKRVQREHADAQPRRRLYHVANRVDPGTMALDTGQVPLRRPAAVAVHDDRHVRRKPIEIDLPGQRLVGRSWRDGGQELVERHHAIISRRTRPTRGTGLRREPSDRRGVRSAAMRTSRMCSAGQAAPDVNQCADDRPHHVRRNPTSFVDNSGPVRVTTDVRIVRSVVWMALPEA